MLFRRKGSLKREYDRLLYNKLEEVKKYWNFDMKLSEHSIDRNDDLDIDIKISRAKYVFLLKEAKERDIRVSKHYF